MRILVAVLSATRAFGDGPKYPALNLTALIEKGDLAAARSAASVKLHGWSHPSYSGFLHTEAGKEMFMWYFPPQSGNSSAPNTLWLQGGPGGSSLFGMFAEMGPFGLDEDLSLVPRPTSWNVEYGYLVIDNPVGAGFSYTTDDGYCNETKECVARNLWSGLEQFYDLFPEQRGNDLYVTGESYAGHYVPALGARVRGP